VETSDVYIGLAASRELTGRDGEALQILSQVTKKFDKSPDAFYRMAQIYHRAKDEPQATEATYQAALRAGNPQISMEALQFLSKQLRWADAMRIASLVKDTETEDPEVKLVIARALQNGGDKAGAQAVSNQARALLAKHPENKAKLEIAYGDILPVKASVPISGLAPPADPTRATASNR
jgi:predicted Zn-dependent protease